MTPNPNHYLKSVFFVAILCISFTVEAWNAKGHMLTAAIAWNRLSPEQQQSVTDLLKHHPDYERKWKSRYADKVPSVIPLGMYLMMEASTWPDVIRDQNDPNHDRHHGPWHYINYRVKFPDQHSNEDLNGGDPDVIWAIGHVQAKLNNPQIAIEEKAMYFCWLLHLIGDVHQPLHTVALFNDQFPDGDRGGNWFHVIAKREPINLHYFWDQLGGRTIDFRKITHEAKKLAFKSPAPDYRQTPVESIRDISYEGYFIGIRDVYLNGQLKSGDDKEHGVKLPKGYTKTAKKIGIQRITQAGYRMGEYIKQLEGWDA